MNNLNRGLRLVLMTTTAFLFAGCGGEVAPSDGSKVVEGPAVGNRAPDFSLENLKGETVKFKVDKGEQLVTLLVFWATWCPSCRDEIPEVNKFLGEYSKRGVRVLSVSVDNGGSGVVGFAKNAGIKYTVLLDKDSSVARDYNVRGIPNVLVVDASGIVRYNGHRVADAEKVVEDLLEKEKKEE